MDMKKTISLDNKSIDNLAIDDQTKNFLKSKGITNYKQIVQCNLYDVVGYVPYYEDKDYYFENQRLMEERADAIRRIARALRTEGLYPDMSDIEIEVYEQNRNSKFIKDNDEVMRRELSSRLYNILRRNGYHNYLRIALASSQEIQNLRLMGKKSFQEIEQFLEKHGLHIGMTPDEIKKLITTEQEEKMKSESTSDNEQTLDNVIEYTEQRNEELTSEIEEKQAKLEKLQQLLEHKQQLEEQNRNLDKQIASVSEQLGIKTEENANGKSRK